MHFILASPPSNIDGNHAICIISEQVPEAIKLNNGQNDKQTVLEHNTLELSSSSGNSNIKCSQFGVESVQVKRSGDFKNIKSVEMSWIKVMATLSAVLVAAGDETRSNATARIVGGFKVKVEDVPFVVEVVLSDRSHIGTATMIGVRIALTSAQVTYKMKATDIMVKTRRSFHGQKSHDPSSSHENDSHESDDLFEVFKIIQHTCFDPMSLENDISILKLFEPVHLKVFPTLPTFLTDPTEDTASIISGWGVRKNLQADYSRELRLAFVHVSNFIECSALYR